VLRAEIARLLGPTEAEPTPPPAEMARGRVAASLLPFVPYETEAGVVLRRLVRHGPAHQVGRAGTSKSLPDSHLLSLLALDPSLSGQDLGRALFFDSETTGLGGAGSVAFLLGLGSFESDGSFVLEQLLLEEPGQELALLHRLRELVDGASILVSYNGKSFDWPLLQGRYVMNRLPLLPLRPHLDLLHVARRVHKRRLSRTNLRAIEEEVLGFDRGEDDIAGADIPARYGHYLRTGDAEAILPVVHHNAWDVASMAALVGVYGEPLSALAGLDLLGVAETLGRAKDVERALDAVSHVLEAEAAWQAAPLTDALEVRARLHKARGDRARALVDFEAVVADVDDERVRLELCKLYEHHAKDYEKALALLAEGTGESDEAIVRRRERLERRARGGKSRA
jgi:uncharacterized protein